MLKEGLVLPSPQTDLSYENGQTSLEKNKARVENRLSGNKYGHDIRYSIRAFDNGKTPLYSRSSFDEIGELYDEMMQKIEPGLRSFNGYEYPATIVSNPNIFYAAEDAGGNTQVIAETFLLGEHYRNGVGRRVPKENEDETRAFIELSSTVWEPGVTARLLSTLSGEFRHAERVYDAVLAKGEKPRSVKRIEQIVFEYRTSQAQKEAAESEAIAAD